jgi:Tfp pilus assembly protein PilX
MHSSQHRQQGAVSLFVVIFATLLMIIITLSFVQLMLKDQRQATASDLSQSAFDSAQSGVEDAKRLLLLEQECRNNAASPAVNCNAVTAAISSGKCNTVAAGIYNNTATDETMIQQRQGDADLQQAYTCVKILADTTDYKGVVDLNQSNIVPLRGTQAFDSISISWFTRDDVAATTPAMNVGFPSANGQSNLPPAGNQWRDNYPSLLRAQLMQTGNNFKLSDFDSGQAGNRSNANTLFLYPSIVGASNLNFSADDVRRDQDNAPEIVRCVSSFASAEYACSVTIRLPAPIDNNLAQRNAFLRLSALYNGAHYKIQLLNAGVAIPFDRVQPEVDSTGRANDMFRRVKTRVEFKSDFIYPEAAVDIGNSLCKNFIITDKDADYSSSATCTP